MDPTKNTKAQLGDFEDEQSFRKHLVRLWRMEIATNGLKMTKSRSKKWVRDTVVKSVSGQGGKPEYEQLSEVKRAIFRSRLAALVRTLKGVRRNRSAWCRATRNLGVNCFGKGPGRNMVASAALGYLIAAICRWGQ
jgi:hypothetical protein